MITCQVRNGNDEGGDDEGEDDDEFEKPEAAVHARLGAVTYKSRFDRILIDFLL